MVQAISTGTFCEAKWVVDPTVGQGTHTTIASALTSASSGDTIFIRSGTYTENLTLKAGVSLAAWPGNEWTGSVTIVGKCSYSSAGLVSISGITLQTNGDFFLEIGGSSGLTNVDIENCYLYCTNNTGISYTTAAAGAILHIFNCLGDITTTGITYISSSSTGLTRIIFCDFQNSGASVTASTFSAGTTNIRNCSIFSVPITTSSTASFSADNTFFNATNATALTLGGSGVTRVINCRVDSGTASAISCGSATPRIINTAVSSTNTNAITGAGTLTYAGLEFWNTSNTINTTTQTASISRPGITLSAHQPAFLAYVNTTVTNVTGDGTVYTIIFDTEVFDQNSDFNLGTSVFTAPYTGKYQFNYQCRIVGGTTITAATMQLVTTARTYNQLMHLIIGATTTANGCISVLANMTAGDTASVSVTTTDGGGKIDDVSGLVSTQAVTFFSGNLVF
jgi:hypothetical protein